MFIRLPLSTKSHSSTLVFLRNCDNASKCVNVFWADILALIFILRSFWHWNIHHAGSRPTGRLLVCQCFIIGRGELPIDNKQCSMQHNSQTQCKIQATPTKSFSICSKQKNRNIIRIVIFFPQSLQLYLHTLFLHRPSTYCSIFLASTSLHPVSLSACGWIVSFPCNTNYCALLRSREQRGEIKDLWSTAL